MKQETAFARGIEGFGLMLGTIVGAGMFVLPSVFYRSGLAWGIFFFVLTFSISIAFHYLYAGLIAITPGKHRFPGYMKIYLGFKAEKISLAFTFLSYYGAFLAYGVLGGIFLEALLKINHFWGAVAFFILGGLFFKMDLRAVGKANFYLTLLLLFFIVALSVFVFRDIDPDSFSRTLNTDWFLPYGVLLFAFAAHSALPDLFEVVGRNSDRLFKKIIFWSLVISALVYILFIVAVLGVTGGQVTEDALTGLYRVVGDRFITVGSLIGLLAVFTSYVALGADLKLTFRYDYKLSDLTSWLAAFLPAVLFFLAGFDDLALILSVVGALGLGVFSFLTALAVWEKRKEISEYLGFPVTRLALSVLGGLVVLGALAELFSLFSIGI